MDAQQRIDRLDRAVRLLRIEWEKFFNGAVTVPPEEMREEIGTEIRSLRNSNLRGLAENYRLNQLEARFNSYSELYGRRLRQSEEGRGPGLPVRRDRQPRLDPRRGVVLGDQVDTATAEALYDGLAQSGRAPRFDLETFRDYLEKQVGALKAKTGCRQVRFRLEEDGDTVKLKAKPVTLKAKPLATE